MTSLLRQIVAGPRAKHTETGLDLCYVTDDIIATSGPSQTYPQRAYRNPLDRLVAFLDSKHSDNWAIWEFRAEGTGYPDEAVYGRIRHYPWPDHHPPPFRLVPMIMASMRNWLNREDDAVGVTKGEEQGKDNGTAGGSSLCKKLEKNVTKDMDKRVVVVHCKAGKGRSGSMACSYLISECGWKPEDALARFTERRMKPKFGAGVSIPSQLRWISYVDRWTRGGKKYVDREVEIVELHVWGLRHGVKVTVEAFADEGKKIKVLHTFTKEERHVVQGDAPGGGGMMDLLGDVLSPQDDDEEIYEDADYNDIVGGDGNNKQSDAGSTKSASSSPSRDKSRSAKGSRTSVLSKKPARNSSVQKLNANPRSKTINPADFTASKISSPSTGSNLSLPNPNTSQPSLTQSSTFADTNEPGGMAVIFKPTKLVRISNSDVSVSLERRNRAPASMGLTMVTAVAHVWFNTFFEGRGPEQDGKSDDSGVFEIDWDKMDGIKGSSRKGAKAADRISVVWRAVGAKTQGPAVKITEPGEGSPVPQMRAADWKGTDAEDPNQGKRLGLRAEEPASEAVSKASSVKSKEDELVDAGRSDEESLKGVKSSDSAGEELGHAEDGNPPRLKTQTQETTEFHEAMETTSEQDKKVEPSRGRTDNPGDASISSASELQLLEAATAGESGRHQGKASATAQKQAEADSKADEENTEDGQDYEGQHGDGEHHLGFVKRGKKVLPRALHKDKSEPGSGPGSGSGSGSGSGDVGKDPRVMTAHIKK